MTQDRIILLLTRKLAGEATKDELQELEELVHIYPDAVYYEEALGQLWNKNESAYEDDIEKAFNKHQSKYQSEFLEEELAFGDPKPKKLRYAAFSTYALLICLGVFWFMNSKPVKDSAASMVEVSSGKGIRKKITLPDKTQVWLNSNSKLVYDSKMCSKVIRSVKLEGEAYFDVAKDKNHPFIITTSKYSIKVLGTAFNVRVYPDEIKSETTLMHGLIELNLNGKHEQKIILKPNEKFSLTEKEESDSKNTGESRAGDLNRKLLVERVVPIKVAQKEYVEEVAWIENQFVFRNETFEELVPRLEQWYNVKINVQNKAIKTVHFTGAFHDESITDALKAMQLIKPFKFKVIENEVEIY